jgi:hypothetical protein
MARALREAMRPLRALVDKDFDRYVLSGAGAAKAGASLSVPALEPLGAAKALRKAQWEARAHHNALASDAFRSGPAGAVAYFVNANFELVQVLSASTTGLGAPPQTSRLYTFPISTGRQENVSLQVAGRGRIVYCDGLGALFFLKAADPDAIETTWRCEYECAPLGAVPAVLLAAAFDEQTQRFHLLAAEPVEQVDTEAAFRLSEIDVFAAKASASVHAAGLTHSAVGIADVPTLPRYVSLSNGRLILLLEGAFQLLMEAQASEVTVETAPAAAASAAGPASPVTPHKRSHNEDDLDDDEMEELLSKFPRAGIGYHGDISGVKSPRNLASSLDFSVPLEERFQKSSTPFSSVTDQPMADASTTSSSTSTSPRTRPLEIPTTESILGGLEECDDRNPFAKATLLQVDLRQKLVVEQVDIDCKEFRFLCSTASVTETPDAGTASALRQKLVFRNDVHGLMYDVEVPADGKLSLRHSATLPAFGFVQASKQEKKFMSALPSAAFACIGEFEKRLFIYLGTAATDSERAQHTRRQFVVELGNEPLLGMQLVSRDTIVVLTPRTVYAVKVPVDSA